MKHDTSSPKNQARQQLKSFAIFFLLLIPLAGCGLAFSTVFSPALPFVLFFTGWFTWTFNEYVLHRFWNHAKGAENSPVVQRHNYHHTHPTDIYISAAHRIIMLLIGLGLIGLSLWLSKYLLLIAGWWAGVFWFFMMHYFLHQHWAARVFPRLVHYHVVHHCKEPDTCFGISVSWWDRVFGTTPKKNKLISGRILSFYYKKEKSRNQRFSILPIVDEKLSES